MCRMTSVSCEPVLTHHHKPALPACRTSEHCPELTGEDKGHMHCTGNA